GDHGAPASPPLPLRRGKALGQEPPDLLELVASLDRRVGLEAVGHRTDPGQPGHELAVLVPEAVADGRRPPSGPGPARARPRGAPPGTGRRRSSPGRRAVGRRGRPTAPAARSG